MTLLTLIIVLVILGVVAWLVSIAPMINPQFKTFITYVLIVVGAIIVISFLANLIGGPSNHVLNTRLY